ncbi:MAG: SIR2 family protein [Hyphomicrobiales bacterium]|nr:MAG: SIR2 family protein [Hyphomicrobiales bacterium]
MLSATTDIATPTGSRTGHADRLAALARDVRAGRLIPYLGPGLLATGPATTIPSAAETLALELAQKVPVGKALRGNLWGTAQYIEQRRHRKTLVQFMAAIFNAPPQPGALHTWLADLHIPLIVDTWYDGALARAFRERGRRDFVEVQGVTRALEQRDVWVRAYDADGTVCEMADISKAPTVIYEPHGSGFPARNFLVADSDYVEVLTEIDIQTPIPDVVKQRRTCRGFLFIGCRFDDQMLRTYARQIAKRSGGGHVVICDHAPTRMERRFFADEGIEVIDAPLADAVAELVKA